MRPRGLFSFENYENKRKMKIFLKTACKDLKRVL